jgi:hypothetical protein
MPYDANRMVGPRPTAAQSGRHSFADLEMERHASGEAAASAAWSLYY